MIQLSPFSALLPERALANSHVFATRVASIWITWWFFVLLDILSVFCPLQACGYALRRWDLRWGSDNSVAIFRPPCNTHAGPGILKLRLDSRSVHAFTVLLVRLYNRFSSGNVIRVIKSRLGGTCSVQERERERERERYEKCIQNLGRNICRRDIPWETLVHIKELYSEVERS
jgi:hypothetical protein